MASNAVLNVWVNFHRRNRDTVARTQTEISRTKRKISQPKMHDTYSSGCFINK